MRSIVVNNKRYFRISDISDALGLTNVYRQARGYEKITISEHTAGGIQSVIYVSEQEAARLINSSRKISSHEKGLIFLKNNIASLPVDCVQAHFFDAIKNIPLAFCNNLTFQQEFVFRGYRFDYFCQGIMLIVELDEHHHNTISNIMLDIERDAFLKDCGFTIIRVCRDKPYDSIPLIIKTVGNLLLSTIKNNIIE